jgi:hypothetical protein
VVRVILAVLLLAPTVVLFATARSSTQDRERIASQELLGVDYLRALQPLTAALLSAEGDAVAGRPVSTATLTQAASTVDSVSARSGDALGLKDRWTGLRAAIAALPPAGSPQAMYAAYSGAADLLLALYQRLEQTSQLANDPQTDTASLQRVAVVDLPQISVGISRYADLVQLGAGEDITPIALANLLAQRLEVGPPGRDLVESLQEAVANTASTTLSGDLLGEQDGIRQAVDAVSTSNGPTGGRITAAPLGRCRRRALGQGPQRAGRADRSTPRRGRLRPAPRRVRPRRRGRAHIPGCRAGTDRVASAPPLRAGGGARPA